MERGKVSSQDLEVTQRRLVALENAIEVSLKIIRDTVYHNRHKDSDYNTLVAEFIVLTEALLSED